jgi:hypothetical protein
MNRQWSVLISLCGLVLAVSCGGSDTTNTPSPDPSPEVIEDTKDPDVPADATPDVVPTETVEDVEPPDTTPDVPPEDIEPDVPAVPDVPPDDVIDPGDVAPEEDAGAPCDEETPCPSLGEVCKQGICVPIVCEAGKATCNEDGTVSKCDPFGSALYTFPCPGGFECHNGLCKPPVANVLVVFDTSGSMNKSIGPNVTLSWPQCEDIDNPSTEIGYSKAAFKEALVEEPINPIRFSLLHFPQEEDFSTNPTCKSGYYDGQSKMSEDPDGHSTGPGEDWFKSNMKEVIGVPFSGGTDDNLDEVLQWMDGVEELVQLTAVIDCNTTTCPGFCDIGNCYLHTNHELRADGGTPLGRTLFYAGEYLRRFVLLEGKACNSKADCSSPHYQCVEGKCRDPLYNCRQTVIVLFTDGGETMNKSKTDFFNPINQAKRMFVGLGCTLDSDCSKDMVCLENLCKPTGLDTMMGQVVSSPGLGVCAGSFSTCNVATSEGCTIGNCEDVSNVFTDTKENVQTLAGHEGQTLQIRVHVIDSSSTDSDTNVGIAFWGGGQYIPVDAENSVTLVEAIQQLTDLKFNISCE